jgi:hypothetical protein
MIVGWDTIAKAEATVLANGLSKANVVASAHSPKRWQSWPY